jgi:hypothetical protein
MFRSCNRDIQTSQIFQEAECLVVIRSHAIKNNDIALLALEPINSVYQDVSLVTFECLLLLVKL